jgi:hypothetical protein
MNQPAPLQSNGVPIQEKRRRRRASLDTKVRVRLKDEYGDGPDIAKLLNASSTGIAFLTNRNYFLGTKLLLTYPYPDGNGLTEEGRVVRVHRLEQELWRVAVALR